MDRRSLMTLAAATAATLSAPALGKTRETGSTFVFNSLGGLSDPNSWGQDGAEHFNARVVRDAIASGMRAINFTIGYVAGPDEPFERSVRDIGIWDERLRRNPETLVKVLSAADIEQARSTNRLGVVYGFQNGAMMGDRADRVDLFADLGVRIIQLTYNIANALGGGSLAPDETPLTAFGREVVKRMNARRLIVDLSHSGRQTCLDAARASAAPICITHTGCRALTDLPRNKTDEELRLVAEKGGYVGIYFMPFLSDGRQITSDDVIAHIEHAIKICGEDGVGIGTDGPTTAIDDMPKWAAAFAEDIRRRRAAGISAPGERPDSYLFAIDMTGPEQFRILERKLRERGHSQARIEKVLGLNFLRYARTIWGA